MPTDDDKWQLLETKVTIDEFSEIAYLPPPFFDLGLRLSDRKSVLQTIDGEAELVIGLPEGDEQRRYDSVVRLHRVGVNNIKHIF